MSQDNSVFSHWSFQSFHKTQRIVPAPVVDVIQTGPGVQGTLAFSRTVFRKRFNKTTHPMLYMVTFTINIPYTPNVSIYAYMDPMGSTFINKHEKWHPAPHGWHRHRQVAIGAGPLCGMRPSPRSSSPEPCHGGKNVNETVIKLASNGIQWSMGDFYGM